MSAYVIQVRMLSIWHISQWEPSYTTYCVQHNSTELPLIDLTVIRMQQASAEESAGN